MSDAVLRALTDDGAFRAITADTTETVRGIVAAQGATGALAQRLGELATGAVLFRETMAPGYRVQAIARGRSGGSLVADSAASGAVRGLVQRHGGQDPDIGAGSQLQLMRTLHNGALAQGIVEIPESGALSIGFMEYMQSSEQVVSMLATNVLLGQDGAVQRAGGYMVQLLPEVGRGPVMIMAERLSEYESILRELANPEFTPNWLMDELLYGLDFTKLEESNVRYACWCDEVRLLSALATLPRDDLEHLTSSSEPLEIGCDYCLKQYRIAPAALRGLLEQS